ncbi:hypothetical protein ACTG16_21730 [Aeromonas sp. 23P]|uniref:hypothetical protein n=1 Tax=Aeromonas sp. 23P TaxID=3452716 RepID=UPI003F7A2CD9
MTGVAGIKKSGVTGAIPDEYWDDRNGRYITHLFFNTVGHHHISDYGGSEQCDLMVVECRDGRWFIEDNWGGDAKGASGVFNPFEKGGFPTFYKSAEEANQRAAEVISSITGTDIESILDESDDE